MITLNYALRNLCSLVVPCFKSYSRFCARTLGWDLCFLSKIDIADGFYRIGIRADDVPKLGIIFPTPPGEESWIVVPLVLPIVWKQTPLLFTTAPKTVADLANARVLASDTSYPHLDLLSESPVKATALSITTMVVPNSFPLPPLRQRPTHRRPRPALCTLLLLTKKLIVLC
jgi:hypothetical protein